MHSKLAVFGVLALWAGSASALALPDLADVHWDGGRIVATPGDLPSVSGQSVKVLQSEQCAHQVGSASVSVSGPCHYLSGIYRYQYQPAGENAHQVAVGFALTRAGGDSHTLIVSMPLDLPAKAVAR